MFLLIEIDLKFFVYKKKFCTRLTSRKVYKLCNELVKLAYLLEE